MRVYGNLFGCKTNNGIPQAVDGMNGLYVEIACAKAMTFVVNHNVTHTIISHRPKYHTVALRKCHTVNNAHTVE